MEEPQTKFFQTPASPKRYSPPTMMCSSSREPGAKQPDPVPCSEQGQGPTRDSGIEIWSAEQYMSRRTSIDPGLQSITDDMPAPTGQNPRSAGGASFRLNSGIAGNGTEPLCSETGSPPASPVSYHSGSVSPHSSHASSLYSMDVDSSGGDTTTTEEGEEGRKAKGGDDDGGWPTPGGKGVDAHRSKEHYRMSVEAKSQAKDGVKFRKKAASTKPKEKEKGEEEEEEGKGFTLLTTDRYKLFVGPHPNAYKLRNSKSLKAHKEAKNDDTTIKLDLQILPDITDSDNERRAKMSVALSLERGDLEDYRCTAVLNVVLYDKDAGEEIHKGQEKREFNGRRSLGLMTDLGSQDMIEKSKNKFLDVCISVEVQFRSISKTTQK